jgi:hypothetical protein
MVHHLVIAALHAAMDSRIWECVLHWPFCPGVFTLVLAVVATLMASRKDPNPKVTAGFIAAIFMLMIGEIWMMGIDRSKHEEEMANQNTAASNDRDRQNRAFKKVADGIDAAIFQGQQQFEMTIRKTNQVLGNITGGDSYAAVFPLHSYAPDGTVSLIIENHGHEILTGVTITIYNQGILVRATEDSINWSNNHRIPVGTLDKNGDRIVLSLHLKPDSGLAIEEDGKNIFRFIVYVGAQNRTCQEFLDFTKGSDGGWRYRYKIYKPSSSNKTGQELVEEVGWSTNPPTLPKRKDN